MPLLRSNVEFAKRVFLDRLTTDQQGLYQADDNDAGPGDVYDYAGCYDPDNLGVGADCSGSAGIFIGAAFNGPDGLQWIRQFCTETFPGSFLGFRQTTQDDLVNNYYPIKVCIEHGGGGPNSHMNCSIDGIVMESNGDYGTCTLDHGAIPQDSDFWNDWWVFDGPIQEDTTYRCPMEYPQGVDYAGGTIGGLDLREAGVSFVCRYLTDGGASLPGKQLQRQEFLNLCTNGISIVFNWETTADFMLNGYDQGVSDAQQALDYIRSLPGAPSQPVVYFSADFDETPDQDSVVWEYMAGANSVLGTNEQGNMCAGIYGDYWVCSRALDANVADYVWQTEAWSGGNVTGSVNIFQRNSLGYRDFNGIQCDIDEAHTDDFGQFTPGGSMPEKPTDLILDQLEGPLGADGSRQGWPQLGNRSIVDYLAQVVGPALQQIQASLTSVHVRSPFSKDKK